MAALGDGLIEANTVKLEATSPPSPASSGSQTTSAESQLQTLLHRAVVQSAGRGLNGAASQVPFNALQHHFANLASEARPPSSPGSTSRTTKVDRLSPTELDPGKTEPCPKRPAASPKDEKPRINNNSVCYTSGGRLKFFKEGRCLLELTHRSGEGGETWVPITKKVYWPPPGPVVAESSPSVQSATSEGGSDSVPSPYPAGVGLCQTVGCAHRIKSRPRNFISNSQSSETLDQLVFCMRPPACIVSLRKKVRNFDKKCRQPYRSIGVAAFIMKLEAEAIKVRPARRPVDRDHIRKASRLEKCVTRVVTKAKQKKSGPMVSIQAWKNTTTSTSTSSASVTKSSSQPKVPVTIPYPPKPPNATSVMRVKSELCPVTETCTAATMPPSSPSTGAKTPKHKNDSRNACLTTTSMKTLPITPTIARIKHEQSGQSPSLVSTDIHGMKVEIGRQYSPTHHMSPAPMMPTSPIPDLITPRKRFLQDLDNTSPAKRHKLNSDSKGVDVGGHSNGGTAASPHPPHLFMHPHGIPSPPRHGSMGNGHSHQPMPHQPKVSSFSIDSLMSGSKFDRVDYGPQSPVNVSSPKPVKPVAMTPRRSPAPSHQPSTPLVVPITPYNSRGIDPRTPIDPRLAHLAGVAADPRLGLSPAATAMAGYMINPFYSSYLAAAAASLWRPSPDASAVSGHQQSSQLPVQSPSPPSTASSLSGPTSYPPWLHQYRGEPRLESSTKRDLEQQKLQDMDTGADSPLNLSVRR